MRHAAVAVILCISVCACRLGGPDAGPLNVNRGPSGAGPEDPLAGGGGDGGASGESGNVGPAPGAGATASEGQGGAGESDGGAGVGAAGTAGAPHKADASVTSDAGASCAPEVQGCNPITNDGCPDAMQCAVDVLSDVLAGYCTFSSPPMVGGCFNSGVTESCPPTATCLDFDCRTLCFCDDDCEAGQCCVQAVGELGFKACGAC